MVRAIGDQVRIGTPSVGGSCAGGTPRAITRTAALVFAVLITSLPGLAVADEEHEELFERRVRPLLVEHCFRCHGPQVPSPKSGLRVDSLEALLEGGKRGPAIMPGAADESLLVQSLRHDTERKLHMPRGKPQLPTDQIDDVARWIDAGAPWPATFVAESESASDDDPQWALKPLTDPQVPESEGDIWSKNAVDRFILASLNAAGLQPAPAADRRALVRRLSFDLIGLPPTPAEVEGFVTDERPDAYERLVERLLASPHYGERWGRHWLDIVGYGETDGHEYDPDKPDVHRYRDYVIAALNQDLPYDQFVREQLAGDLLEAQRFSLDGAREESSLATGFYWLGSVQNVPVDEPLADANQIERQIDVIGKAFLGLTMACARCHDHKFDPLPTTDYYALAGVLYSSRRVHRWVDSPALKAQMKATRQSLSELRRRVRHLELKAQAAAQVAASESLSDYLLAAAEVARRQATDDERAIAAAAQSAGLDADRLARWVDHLTRAAEVRDPIFYPWTRLGNQTSDQFAARAASLADNMSKVKARIPGELSAHDLFEDFESSTYEGWTQIGPAFGAGPTMAGPAVSEVIGQGYADSSAFGDRMTGRLLSPKFVVPGKFINFLIAGGEHPQRACLNLIIYGQPQPETTATGDGTSRFRSVSFDVRNLIGREAHIELVDEVAAPGGYVAVDQIFFSNEEPDEIVRRPNARVLSMISSGKLPSAEALASAYGELFADVLSDWQEQSASDPAARQLDDPADEQLRSFLLGADNPAWVAEPEQDFLSPGELAELDKLRSALAETERRLPRPATAMIASDGEVADVAVQISGQPSSLGDVVPRGVPPSLADDADGPVQGSGRLEVAHWMTSPDNPLFARVVVNRLWHYHFGAGLVSTPDNFGSLGERPTHPELLDYLAQRLIDSGWSLKAMHRLLVMSAAYRQGGMVRLEAREIDPANRLLHHMPLRRLDAECIRDAILTVAGNLNSQMYGPGVPLHIEPYMQGRSVPAESGPMHGDHRRTIYQQVRRNYLPPMLVAFDFPKPDTTIGRRAAALVATQSLVLLNNEFVHHEAAAWGARIAALLGNAASRIGTMYAEALNRPPNQEELTAAADFIAAQTTSYLESGANIKEAEQHAWADLGHMLWASSEFLFVP